MLQLLLKPVENLPSRHCADLLSNLSNFKNGSLLDQFLLFQPKPNKPQ